MGLSRINEIRINLQLNQLAGAPSLEKERGGSSILCDVFRDCAASKQQCKVEAEDEESRTPDTLPQLCFMETESSGRLGGKDDDIDVDHYFLPGGILDTHHEEDMIGGSLLDEIGGAANVKAVRCCHLHLWHAC